MRFSFRDGFYPALNRNMSVISVPDSHGQKHQVSSNKLIARKAVYGLYVKNNELLMVRDRISNNWEFPGGGIENNESPLKALKREFFEETGLTILNDKMRPNKIIYSCLEFFFDINSNEAWKTRRIFYLVSKARGSLLKEGNNKDIEQVVFFSLENLPFSEVSNTVNQVLGELLRLYKEGLISKVNS